MIDPVAFYRKPLDEQAAILEKEARLVVEKVKTLWKANKTDESYKIWRQTCDFYALAFQHKTFIEQELFS